MGSSRYFRKDTPFRLIGIMVGVSLVLDILWRAAGMLRHSELTMSSMVYVYGVGALVSAVVSMDAIMSYFPESLVEDIGPACSNIFC